MTASQMMLFGGGPPPITYTGRIFQLSQTSNSFTLGGIAAVGTDTYVSQLNTYDYTFDMSKISSTGTITWNRKLTLSDASDAGVASKGFPSNTVADSSGNIYSVLWWGIGQDGRFGYIVKRNSSGTLQWQRQLTHVNNNVMLESIAIDSTGSNIVVGGVIVVNSASASIVAKYNSSGTLQWQRQLSTGNYNNVQVKTIAIDSSDNVFVGGQESVTGSFRGFVMKYDSAGTLQWQQYISAGSNQANVTKLQFDSSGNIYGSGIPNLFKLNSSGTLQWGYMYNSAIPFPNGYGLVLDTTTGNMWGMGGNPSSQYASFSKFDSSGNNTLVNRITLTGSVNSPGYYDGCFGETGYIVQGAPVYSNALGTGSIAVWKLPLDMSKTSLPGSISMTGFTFNTYNTDTPVSTTTTSASSGANSITDAAGSIVSAGGSSLESAGSLVITTSTF